MSISLSHIAQAFHMKETETADHRAALVGVDGGGTEKGDGMGIDLYEFAAGCSLIHVVMIDETPLPP